MLAVICGWLDHRRAIRRRWQTDARRLAAAEEANVYYEAQRRAAQARVRGETAEFYHWAKVAAEIARISLQAEMDIEKVWPRSSPRKSAEAVDVRVCVPLARCARQGKLRRG
ncbi:hypothetical protein [Chelativorans intermedius]|uniref:Uncharacterized protein n=1 Tax=Chelativorans intermedius TaxID=515947 RepID=A0ABV6DBD3_9HYPH|nr:hypothetical protein [Chelativorans intermedius]MCT9000293.1 hypothetical protein [Chelativorans intermedius]